MTNCLLRWLHECVTMCVTVCVCGHCMCVGLYVRVRKSEKLCMCVYGWVIVFGGVTVENLGAMVPVPNDAKIWYDCVFFLRRPFQLFTRLRLYRQPSLGYYYGSSTSTGCTSISLRLTSSTSESAVSLRGCRPTRTSRARPRAVGLYILDISTVTSFPSVAGVSIVWEEPSELYNENQVGIGVVFRIEFFFPCRN